VLEYLKTERKMVSETKDHLAMTNKMEDRAGTMTMVKNK
jgi:hypothetical protein